MKHTLYLVTLLEKKHKIKFSLFYGRENKDFTIDLKLKWAKGMIGVLPVFVNYEDALKYANNDKNLVVELEIVDEK